jgi:SAM-dependent methyltransferase
MKIDEFIKQAEEIRGKNYDSFIQFCNQNNFDMPEEDGLDPFSAEYRQQVLGHYLELTGSATYAASYDELAHFEDLEAPLHRQFPFMTKDPQTIGRYLMGVGHMVENIGVPSGSHIVEYGVGWGHISLALGQAGYDVACVDIEPNFVDLINRRAHNEKSAVRAYQGEFGFRPDPDRPVDAVIFFEAFHHSLDHVSLTRDIHDMLRPGGRLLLGGESFYSSFPRAWGLRLDGQSVWAIRSFRWMELGFREDYVIRLLLRHGFIVEKKNNSEIGPLGLLYIATKLNGDIEPGNTLLPTDEALTWNIGDESLKFSKSRSVISVADLVGWSKAEIHMRNYLPLSLDVTIELGKNIQTFCIQGDSDLSVVLPLSANSGPLIIVSETHCPADIGVNDDLRHLGVALTSISYR